MRMPDPGTSGRVRLFDGIGKLKNLTPVGSPDTGVGETFGRMATLLQGSGITGTIQFHVMRADQDLPFTLTLGDKASVASPGSASNPDLEVFVTLESWLEIASGALSPIEAAARGLIRVRGDHHLGLKAAALLTAIPGRV
jgi:SCP-2 sterol transfer family